MPAHSVGISLLVRGCLAIPLNQQECPRFFCGLSVSNSEHVDFG
nr:MAG TPA: hypothetical protein [Caudoviricetes sp.]